MVLSFSAYLALRQPGKSPLRRRSPGFSMSPSRGPSRSWNNQLFPWLNALREFRLTSAVANHAQAQPARSVKEIVSRCNPWASIAKGGSVARGRRAVRWVSPSAGGFAIVAGTLRVPSALERRSCLDASRTCSLDPGRTAHGVCLLLWRTAHGVCLLLYGPVPCRRRL